MERTFFILGALAALLGVATGAFGAHVLKGRISPEMLTIFEKGVRYQMYHAFALIASAWAQARWPGTIILAGGWCFVAGIVIFSGSLYLLSVSTSRWPGMVTVLGGLAFLAGWACLAWGAWKA